VPSVVPVLNHYFLWSHRQPVLSAHSVHSLVLLFQEQDPSLHIHHLPNRLRFTLQQKIALAAQGLRIRLLMALVVCSLLDRYHNNNRMRMMIKFAISSNYSNRVSHWAKVLNAGSLVMRLLTCTDAVGWSFIHERINKINSDDR
jgi:hypothetical protein